MTGFIGATEEGVITTLGKRAAATIRQRFSHDAWMPTICGSGRTWTVS